MIRQRVDRHGNIYDLEPASELPACNIPPGDIGVIKEGPVRKWMAAKREWDTKFSSSKRKVQKRRAKEIAEGYQQFDGGEVPPPSALAGRRKAGIDLKEKKNKRSMGMSLWALWGNKHDEKAIVLEEKTDKEPETTTASATDGAGARPLHDTKTVEGKKLDVQDVTSRSRSRRRTVVDQNQTGSRFFPDENTPASEILAMQNPRTTKEHDSLTPAFIQRDVADMPEITIQAPTHDDSDYTRLGEGGMTLPSPLREHPTTASMITLHSSVGVAPTKNVTSAGAMESGVHQNSADIAASENIGKNVVAGAENERASEDSDRTTTATSLAEPDEKIIANGEVMSAQRPPLETFVTAQSHFTLASMK